MLSFLSLCVIMQQPILIQSCTAIRGALHMIVRMITMLLHILLHIYYIISKETCLYYNILKLHDDDDCQQDNNNDNTKLSHSNKQTHTQPNPSIQSLLVFTSEVMYECMYFIYESIPYYSTQNKKAHPHTQIGDFPLFPHFPHYCHQKLTRKYI